VPAHEPAAAAGPRHARQSLDDGPLHAADVGDDGSLDRLFATLGERFGSLDYLVHSIAYAPAATFENRFVETTRDDWKTAMDVSAYSLVACAQRAAPLMTSGGSMVTLSYLAAERVVPHYNMMGVAKAALEASVRYLAADLGPQNIRVNAISAGPIKTLSASGIAGFRKMLHYVEERAPLRRNVDQDEVGNAALWLCSDLASGVTGEVVYVDAGYNILGMPEPPERWE